LYDNEPGVAGFAYPLSKFAAAYFSFTVND
jgi:hypothetical protein